MLNFHYSAHLFITLLGIVFTTASVKTQILRWNICSGSGSESDDCHEYASLELATSARLRIRDLAGVEMDDRRPGEQSKTEYAMIVTD